MRARRVRRSVARLAAFAGLVVLLGGIATVVVASSYHVRSEERRPAAVAKPARAKPKPKPRPKPAKPKAVAPRPKPGHLTAVATYDPEGDGHEKDELIAQATDGDAATYWTSETYSSWGWKKGVGLVLDAGRPVLLKQLLVVTDEPGWTAQIRAGASAKGPFVPVSPSSVTTGTTVYALDEASPRRYRVIWITQLGPTPTSGGAAHVNEVRARF
jgi:hypothetical protein